MAARAQDGSSVRSRNQISRRPDDLSKLKVLLPQQLAHMLVVADLGKADAHAISARVSKRYNEAEDYNRTYNILVRLAAASFLEKINALVIDAPDRRPRKTFMWSVTESGHRIIKETGRFYRKLSSDVPIGGSHG